jgi:hypothetical protein
MTAKLRDRALRLLAGAVASLPFLQAVARAEPVIGLDMNGRIEHSTNPFLADQANASATRAAITVSPYLELNTARSQLRVSGSITHSEYSRIYDSSTNFEAGLNYRTALTSRLNLTGAAGFSSSSAGNFIPEAVSVAGLPSILPNPTDIALVGSQNLRNQFRGALGVSYTPDTRNSWTLDYSGIVVRFPDTPVIAGARRGEFNSISQDVGYSRTINAKLSVGAGLGLNRIDYRGTSIGDSVVISPTVNASLRLSSRWRVSGGIGMTFLRQTAFFGRDTSTSLAGNLSACRIDTRDSFCLTGSRSVEPSSLGAARKETAIGATYTYRLNTRDDLSFSGNYVQSDETSFGPISKVNFYGGQMTFKRQFNNKFAISADAGFSRSEFASTRASARIGLGIVYHLDSRR